MRKLAKINTQSHRQRQLPLQWLDQSLPVRLQSVFADKKGTETHFMISNPFLHVRSPKLRVLPGEDDELINEGMYGRAFAEYLRDGLAQNGFQATHVVCEDWGWWVTIAGLPFSCGLGIYGVRIDETDDLDLCVTVLAPRGKKWSWAKFGFVDTTPQIDRLHETVRAICAADNDVTIVAETPDFPL